MSQLQTSSVIWPLENVRERVTQRLTNMPEYRAFLAIELPIAEVSEIPDLLAHLEMSKQKILDRLNLTREYRSLLAVDKAIKEISEVLKFLNEEKGFDAVPAQAVAPAPLANAPIAIPYEPSVVGLTAFLHESLATQMLASEVRLVG
jgi:hypothetical protein